MYLLLSWMGGGGGGATYLLPSRKSTAQDAAGLGRWRTLNLAAGSAGRQPSTGSSRAACRDLRGEPPRRPPRRAAYVVFYGDVARIRTPSLLPSYALGQERARHDPRMPPAATPVVPSLLSCAPVYIGLAIVTRHCAGAAAQPGRACNSSETARMQRTKAPAARSSVFCATVPPSWRLSTALTSAVFCCVL